MLYDMGLSGIIENRVIKIDAEGVKLVGLRLMNDSPQALNLKIL